MYVPNIFARIQKWGTRATARGFTLIEIIVVVAIMLLLAGIMYASVRSFVSAQSRESLTEDIREGVRSAREKTMASVHDTTYGIYIGTSSAVVFTGAAYNPERTDTVVIPYQNGIVATSSFAGGSTWEIVFSRLTGEASATGTITIVDTTTNASNTMTITRTGLVE